MVLICTSIARNKSQNKLIATPMTDKGGKFSTAADITWSLMMISHIDAYAT